MSTRKVPANSSPFLWKGRIIDISDIPSSETLVKKHLFFVASARIVVPGHTFAKMDFPRKFVVFMRGCPPQGLPGARRGQGHFLRVLNGESSEKFCGLSIVPIFLASS